jgi:hypothetical protein
MGCSREEYTQEAEGFPQDSSRQKGLEGQQEGGIERQAEYTGEKAEGEKVLYMQHSLQETNGRQKRQAGTGRRTQQAGGRYRRNVYRRGSSTGI